VDGWHLKAVDLYNEPVLFVRSPDGDSEQRFTYSDDDPYYSEISAFIDAAELGSASVLPNESAIADDDDSENEDEKKAIPTVQYHSGILSSFRDACGTYGLTW
jgi:hypothetical protein